MICKDGTADFPASTCTYPPFDYHCPVGYEQRGECCYKIPCPSPTPTPPACDGTLSWSPYPSCSWTCLPPLPSNNSGSEDSSGVCSQEQALDCINSLGQWD